MRTSLEPLFSLFVFICLTSLPPLRSDLLHPVNSKVGTSLVTIQSNSSLCLGVMDPAKGLLFVDVKVLPIPPWVSWLTVNLILLLGLIQSARHFGDGHQNEPTHKVLTALNQRLHNYSMCLLLFYLVLVSRHSLLYLDMIPIFMLAESWRMECTRL